MEGDKEQLDRLNQSTCLLLGKMAHIEDMLTVSTIQARTLLADIALFAERYS